jgi:hypothetical protein
LVGKAHGGAAVAGIRHPPRAASNSGNAYVQGLLFFAVKYCKKEKIQKNWFQNFWWKKNSKN